MKTKLKLGILLLAWVLLYSSPATGSGITPESMLHLINQDRAEYGLPALTLNQNLNLAAQAKAFDMLTNDYFSHISPDGISPWHWFKILGYKYTYAGENLAAGYSDSYELQSSWMSSASHRANILSPYYAEVGLAVVENNDQVFVVEFFGNRSSQVSLK